MSNKKIQLDPPYLDNEENEILEAFDRGEFQSLPDQKKAKKEHVAAAKNTLKRKVINIRLPLRDIDRIKQLAKRDGIPYQILISSIIHRYADGTLKRAD